MDGKVSSVKLGNGHASPGAGPAVQYRSYPGRFYILMVAALFGMQGCIAWLTFGPIPEQAKLEYGLTDLELTLLSGIELSCTVSVKYDKTKPGIGASWILSLVLIGWKAI